MEVSQEGHQARLDVPPLAVDGAAPVAAAPSLRLGQGGSQQKDQPGPQTSSDVQPQTPPGYPAHRVWLLGYKHAQLHAATGTGWLVPAAPDPGSDTGQAWWLALTLGDEVGALPGDRHGAQWRQSGYAALLGITGALLVEVVEAVKARVGPIPETASSDSGIDSDPE